MAELCSLGSLAVEPDVTARPEATGVGLIYFSFWGCCR